MDGGQWQVAARRRARGGGGAAAVAAPAAAQAAGPAGTAGPGRGAWDCRFCGARANWATRPACRVCLRAAPAGHGAAVQVPRAAPAQRLRSGTAGGGQGGPGVGGGSGRSFASVVAAVAPTAVPDSPEAAALKGRISALTAAVKALKGLPELAEQAASLEVQVEALQKQLQAMRPLGDRYRSAQDRLKARRAAAVDAEAKVAAAKEALKAAEAAAVAAQEELDKAVQLEEELRGLLVAQPVADTEGDSPMTAAVEGRPPGPAPGSGAAVTPALAISPETLLAALQQLLAGPQAAGIFSVLGQPGPSDPGGPAPASVQRPPTAAVNGGDSGRGRSRSATRARSRSRSLAE